MRTRLAFALFLTSSLNGTAQAALYDRGGGLIYDSALNITWLQDANYAATELSDARANAIITAVNAANPSWLGGHVMAASDFPKSGSLYLGFMTWWGAMAWADQLVYGGFSDWRLPTVSPINGSTFNYSWSYDGSSDYAYSISAPGTVYAGSPASELAYMYYNNLLGNVPHRDTSGNLNPGWTGVVSPSFVDAVTGVTKAFDNLRSYWYWSGVEYAPSPSHAWGFLTQSGGQDHFEKWSYIGFAWPVRPGDVPLPGAGLLFASALVGLGFSRLRTH